MYTTDGKEIEGLEINENVQLSHKYDVMEIESDDQDSKHYHNNHYKYKYHE